MRTRFTLAVVLGVAVTVLAGCCGSPKGRNLAGYGSRAAPMDLPANPDPCATYCREWVPPVYRKAPRLVRASSPCSREVEDVYLVSTYDEVQVRPKECYARVGCGKTCEESAVQVTPGGYRWESDGTCWKYKYRPPTYKWCNRVVEEEGVTYCNERPAKYETVVRTELVRKKRREYVPPKYKVEYVDKVYSPGHYVWKARYDKSPCNDQGPGRRAPRKFVLASDCARCN